MQHHPSLTLSKYLLLFLFTSNIWSEPFLPLQFSPLPAPPFSAFMCFGRWASSFTAWSATSTMFPPRPPSPPSGPALGWNLVSYTLQLFQKARDLQGQNVFAFWVFLRCWSKSEGSALSALDLLGNRSLLQRVQKVMVCDLWLVDFDPFCVFLCFKVYCFWTSESTCFHILALKFFYLLTKTWQV